MALLELQGLSSIGRFMYCILNLKCLLKEVMCQCVGGSEEFISHQDWETATRCSFCQYQMGTLRSRVWPRWCQDHDGLISCQCELICSILSSLSPLLHLIHVVHTIEQDNNICDLVYKINHVHMQKKSNELHRLLKSGY